MATSSNEFTKFLASMVGQGLIAIMVVVVGYIVNDLSTHIEKMQNDLKVYSNQITKLNENKLSKAEGFELYERIRDAEEELAKADLASCKEKLIDFDRRLFMLETKVGIKGSSMSSSFEELPILWNSEPYTGNSKRSFY